MAEQPVQHIKTRKKPIYWDWWAENPVEIILLVFILSAFFLLPRTGCGVSTRQAGAPLAPTETAAINAPQNPAPQAP